MSTSCALQQSINEIINTETPNPILLVTPPVSEQTIPGIQPTATESVILQSNELLRTKYKLNVYYDHYLGILKVDERITYFNKTLLDLETIPLILPFKSIHEFKLGEIKLDNLNQSVWSIIDDVLWVNLYQPLRIGESVSISFKYEITIPAIESVLGRSSLQVNLADFYPMIPPYSSLNGWIINEPGDVGEYLVYDLSDFELEFSTNAPNYYQVFSNSTIEEVNNVYSVKAENYRNLVITICTRCTRVESDCGEFKVIGSFDNEDESKGQVTVNIITQALVFFSDTFGVDYPHPEMTIIEVGFPDGMEYDGLFFLSKDYFDQYNKSFKNYLSLLTVHETAHQWWFGLVANDQAIEPWLDEALATYSEYLFLEKFYPDLTDWWWEFRINRYNPTGSIDSDIHEFDSPRPYINAVYLRGATFLHELRSLLTDEVFFLRVQQYTEKYQGLIANGEAFKNTLMPDMAIEEIILMERYFNQ